MRSITLDEALVIVKQKVDEAYAEAHQLAGTITGDETPVQFLLRDELETDLAFLIACQVNQNVCTLAP